MTLSRRRFLTISAAFAAAPAGAQAHSWQGHAFGAEVSLTIRGPREQAQMALTTARRVIAKIEKLFSLYDPNSSISELNRTGMLAAPDPEFLDLMRSADAAVKISDGLFDPTVQPLWIALAEGRDPTEAIDAIGWDKVKFAQQHVIIGSTQALTFNGIAQGYATDRIADMLASLGFSEALVNIGEYRGNGGPWKLGLSDPNFGILGHRTVTDGAIATSSPAATMLGQFGHILHRNARPLWSTVAVEAERATLADSLSTSMVLAPRDQIEAIKDQAGITRVTLVDFDGNLVTI